MRNEQINLKKKKSFFSNSEKRLILFGTIAVLIIGIVLSALQPPTEITIAEIPPVKLR